MLLVVKSNWVRIQIQNLAQLVWDVGPYLLVATIFKPDFQKTFLGSQWQSHANYTRLFELLTFENEFKVI